MTGVVHLQSLDWVSTCFWHAGSQFTGTAINPARALGPAIVFHCHWNVVWLYVIAGKHGSTTAP